MGTSVTGGSVGTSVVGTAVGSSVVGTAVGSSVVGTAVVGTSVVGTAVVGVGVREGVMVGARVGGGRVGVRLAMMTGVRVDRGLLVAVGVIVTKRICVSVGWGVRDAGTGVLLGVIVSVGTKTVTICSVSAAAVPKLETARSTMLIGSSVMGIYRLRSPMAMAETLHSRLSPMAPATRIPKGPVYSLAFTLVDLL